MARTDPVHAGLVWLADNLTSRGRNHDMVNEWTSNDVPSVPSLDLYNRRPDLDLDGKRFGAAVAFEAMVEHLNAHHPKPYPEDGTPKVVWRERALEAEAHCVRWRRAHSIVKAERDQARAKVRDLASKLAKCMSDFQDMEDERDEWKARAEAGQAVDPLLDKALEFAALADWELTDREAGLLHTVARHVLGQEAKR